MPPSLERARAKELTYFVCQDRLPLRLETNERPITRIVNPMHWVPPPSLGRMYAMGGTRTRKWKATMTINRNAAWGDPNVPRLAEKIKDAHPTRNKKTQDAR